MIIDSVINCSFRQDHRFDNDAVIDHRYFMLEFSIFSIIFYHCLSGYKTSTRLFGDAF